MTNPATHAFFLGRALAQTLTEKLEDTLSQTLSELGKFDAEARQNLQQFTQEIMQRAERELGNQATWTSNPNYRDGARESEDLQETIDELRAEIAQLKAELKNTSHSSP